MNIFSWEVFLIYIMRLCTLNIQTSINLNSHARHTSIFSQHDVCIHTILQKRLVLQRR